MRKILYIAILLSNISFGQKVIHPLCTQARAWENAVTDTVKPRTMYLIEVFISNEVKNGNYSNEILWWAGQNSSTNSMTSLTNTVGVCNQVNSPKFSQYQGFRSNRTSSYITTPYSLNGNARYSQNSAVLFEYDFEDTTALTLAQIDFGISASAETAPYSALFINDAGNDYGINNTSTIPSATAREGAGFYLTQRTSSTTMTLFKDGVSVLVSTATSTTVGAFAPYVLCVNSAGTPLAFTGNGIELWGYGLGTVNVSVLNSDVQALTTSSSK